MVTIILMPGLRLGAISGVTLMPRCHRKSKSAKQVSMPGIALWWKIGVNASTAATAAMPAKPGLAFRVKRPKIVCNDPYAKANLRDPRSIERSLFSVLAMNEDYAKLIVSLPLFHGFTTHGAQMLMECGDIKEHAPGEILFREGDAATFVLLVLAGTLQVFAIRQERDLVLREPGPGTILGELAVLCGIPRSASVRVREKSVVLRWSDQDFRRLLIRNALLSERILGEALRALIDKERALIDSLIRAQRGENTAA
jgi:CRP/FNR family transcriptional regulator/CRP/FNR family cyclic AMP-dependent transcriptional regulator